MQLIFAIKASGSNPLSSEEEANSVVADEDGALDGIWM